MEEEAKLRKQYILSYSGYEYRDNEKVFTYKWVGVTPNQIPPGITAYTIPPLFPEGEIVRLTIEGKGNIVLKATGNRQLRELTRKELEREVVSIRPPEETDERDIRLG